MKSTIGPERDKNKEHGFSIISYNLRNSQQSYSSVCSTHSKNGNIGFGIKMRADIDSEDVTRKNIATSVIISNGKILILKRSQLVGTYKGRWACVSGYIEQGETAFETALREISEELGFGRNDVKLVREGRVLHARDGNRLWAIHPFLFETKKTRIELDWEHEEYRWIHIEEISRYETVPKLKETIESVINDHRKKS